MANPHKSNPDADHRRRRTCCKRHPKHRQSPGVCSLCLTEKLSQILSAPSSSRKISDSLSSSSTSYYSSASSCSSCSSPIPFDYYRPKTSLMFKKSRSVAVAPRLSDNGDQKSRLGFWSRFLSRTRRKRMEYLMHSSTVVQRRNDVHG